MGHQTPTAGENREQQVDPRRWYALAVILLPILLNSLNTYMIQVALPLIQHSLHASFSDAQLIVTCFSLSLAVALVVSGKLGDIYGRKRLLLVGVSGFTLMALLGGLTASSALLIVIRLVQGLAAALIQPQVLSMMQLQFLPREKGLVFSIYGALLGFGFAFAPTLGGMLLHWNVIELGWRTIFFFNVPFGMLILLCMPLLPESSGERTQKVDWTGTAFLMSGLFMLVYPLSEGQKQGWPDWIWGCLALSLLLLLAFVAVEVAKQKRKRVPLIDLAIFKQRLFGVGMAAVILIYLSTFSFYFILTYYLQFGLHFDAQATSLAFLPLGGGFFLTSLISSRVVDRWGMSVLRIGALVTGICCFVFCFFLQMDAVHLLRMPFIALFFVHGLGVGLVTTPLTRVVLSTVPAKDAGTGSGLFNTVMYMANSLGVALIGILFSAALGQSMASAVLSDYARAFSTSLTACGSLALAAFGCLCFLPNRHNP
ncbi:MFS transporter [Brevibacillus parabrevis]|uniref:Putative actinorhodin transporter n=1 Tax=Brevibacillus parabrevis TaxID=54914 RepID=A0A4Y3PFV3_BREPA|nr:MFS transporter [Brevibacillus parabrevis]RNB96162.1 MFS transporter [Brevibacillus parabrevis]GEB32227.1 putative actinorhodin transporter [Brevibacillus parabrevis]